MKRKEVILLVIIMGLWVAWPVIDRMLVKPLFRDPPPAEYAAQPEEEAEPVPFREPDTPPIVAPETPPEEPIPDRAPVQRDEPERTVRIDNQHARITFTSRGAGVASVVLEGYRKENTPQSPWVELDFTARPALVYEGLPDFGPEASFSIERAPDGRSVLFTRSSPAGLHLRRTIRLGDGYLMEVTDEFTNQGTAPMEWTGISLRTGPMHSLHSGASQRGVAYLGVDTLAPGDKVRHWSKRIPRYFRDARNDGPLPVEITQRPHDNPVEWIAAKNKYFVQILTVEEGATWAEIHARRETLPQEKTDPSFRPRMQPLESVSARAGLQDLVLAPGASMRRTATYYAGPKKLDELAALGMHREDVMEFGMWAPVGKVLLRMLNALQAWIWPHNYGLAIIFLTIIIRIVFWPITHKSTESMKKMSAIQPLVQAAREKYKDQPQKQQQEIMALYKEHKVNPVGGCLPMLIQIPVFIALFVVLRSAIELRFARFLWIRDLSEPEGLLAGMLPIPLNILPLLMTVTMVWQQKLTPTAGDSQQKKMMAFMPIMMLFIFYNMAAGLVLYWTTNQCLMIAQQLLLRRRQAAGKALEVKPPKA